MRLPVAPVPDEQVRILPANEATGARSTSGLIAYVEDEPAGWVAVEPRTAYQKLPGSPVPWRGRDEDKDDDGVWALTCFVVRRAFRGRGLIYPLAGARSGSPGRAAPAPSRATR